jgi:hypothetical protein
MPNGVKIAASSVCGWLQECNLVWTCVCFNKTADGYHLATFINHRDGTVSVGCNQEDGCHFNCEYTFESNIAYC